MNLQRMRKPLTSIIARKAAGHTARWLALLLFLCLLTPFSALAGELTNADDLTTPLASETEIIPPQAIEPVPLDETGLLDEPTSSEEAVILLDEPAVSSEEPVVVPLEVEDVVPSEEPLLPLEVEPVVPLAEEPVTPSVEDPVIPLEEPVVSSQEPVVPSEEPVVSSEAPVIAVPSA